MSQKCTEIGFFYNENCIAKFLHLRLTVCTVSELRSHYIKTPSHRIRHSSFVVSTSCYHATGQEFDSELGKVHWAFHFLKLEKMSTKSAWELNTPCSALCWPLDQYISSTATQIPWSRNRVGHSRPWSLRIVTLQSEMRKMK